MLLGILADTHDEFDRAQYAVQLLRAEGAEAIIHCGDLASPPIVSLLAGLSGWFALGNHDADAVADLQLAAGDAGVTCLGWGGLVELGGKRIGVVHGHMTTDVRRVMAARPDYLLSGHSHFPSSELVRGVRRINPGALHRAEEFTVALLEVDSGELRFLRVPNVGD